MSIRSLAPDVIPPIEFPGAGFGAQGKGNYDAPNGAMQNAQPGEKLDLCHRFVVSMEQSGKYLIRR